jgi:hypothetical protein
MTSNIVYERVISLVSLIHTGTCRLADQSKMIYQAQLAAQEAEETGQGIMTELGRNREAIEGIRAKVIELS